MNPQNECISNCTNRYVTCEKNYRHPFVLNKRDRKAHIHSATDKTSTSVGAYCWPLPCPSPPSPPNTCVPQRDECMAKCPKCYET